MADFAEQPECRGGGGGGGVRVVLLLYICTFSARKREIFSIERVPSTFVWFSWGDIFFIMKI